MCPNCLRKMRQIDELDRKFKKAQRRINELEKRLGQRARSAGESPFGANGSSATIIIKPNSAENKQQLKGGAKQGHRGHGRKKPEVSIPAEVLAAPARCPACGGSTRLRKIESRHVRDHIPEQVIDRHYTVQTCECGNCGKLVEAEVPGVMPRAKYSNQFVTDAACEHYLGGRTQGDVAARFGIGLGAFNNSMQSLAGILKPCMERLELQFIADPVRFSDETGYREDGVGRYAWLLSTLDVSLFLVGRTRAGDVPLELLSPFVAPHSGLLHGILCVDRYSAYNRLPLLLQYCYAHLKRDAEKLTADFPKVPEVKAFSADLVRQLSMAMRLHGKKRLSDTQYYAQAEKIKAEIIRICDNEAKHPAIQHLQNVFRTNQHRLYHWVSDRRVPPHNNYSERSLRPLVISRKLSFGTQSAKGSQTRGILMSVLHSLKKQGHDPAVRIREALNLKAQNPKLDVAGFLFPEIKRHPPLRTAPDEGVHAGIKLTPPYIAGPILANTA